ncbi:MAG: hypothetical protein ACXW11_11955 [Methylotenera sp.]
MRRRTASFAHHQLLVLVSASYKSASLEHGNQQSADQECDRVAAIGEILNRLFMAFCED